MEIKKVDKFERRDEVVVFGVVLFGEDIVIFFIFGIGFRINKGVLVEVFI